MEETKVIKMRNCPFCGKKIRPVFPYLSYLEKNDMWAFNHCCDEISKGDSFGVNLYSESKERIIKLWNGEELE